MSVIVCPSPASLFHVESESEHTWLATPQTINKKQGEHSEQSEIWSTIQSQPPPATLDEYVHPLVRRSSSLMSQSSLQMCTEGLGSETGFGDHSDDDQSGITCSDNEEETVAQEKEGKHGGDVTSNHCFGGRKSPTRTFPPPLSSISRDDGSCIQMRTHRQDGRLVMEAVPIASHNYLHARRRDGRLLLSFVNSANPEAEPQQHKEDQKLVEAPEYLTPPPSCKKIVSHQEEAEDEEEDEEEVEVLDRGTMVEVKVSTQPQQPSGAMKVQRSSLFINKFVGGTPTTNQNRWVEPIEEENQKSWSEPSPPRRFAGTTTTAAAAAVAASSASASSDMFGQQSSPDNKLLFKLKRQNRVEMLHYMRRCIELRRPLFFWEAGCNATSF